MVAKASAQGLQSSFTINASFKAAATPVLEEEVVIVETKPIVESDDEEA